MAWVKLSDDFPIHPKILELSDREFRFFIAAICYSARYLTDGKLTRSALDAIGMQTKYARVTYAIEALEAAGLLDRNGTGWTIHDYTKYNPTAAQIKAERESAALRMKRWRAKRDGVSDGVTNGVGHGVSSPSPSRPSSSQEEEQPRYGVTTCPQCGPITLVQGNTIDDHIRTVHGQ